MACKKGCIRVCVTYDTLLISKSFSKLKAKKTTAASISYRSARGSVGEISKLLSAWIV